MNINRPIASIKVPVDMTKPPPRLCKDCRFFVRNGAYDIKTGLCSRYATVHLVDGSVQYEYAEVARLYECKGLSWMPRIEPSPVPGYNENKNITH